MSNSSNDETGREWDWFDKDDVHNIGLILIFYFTSMIVGFCFLYYFLFGLNF